MLIRNKRDFWSGVMFAVFGLLFMYFSQQYQMGTAAKMGPGYFPTVLGGIMFVLGAAICWGSTMKRTPKGELSPVGWREIGLILASVIAFAALLPKFGIIVALVALIFIASKASHEFSIKATFLATIVLAILSYIVFVKGLELQFPLLPAFMTK